ncbi:MAG: antibiotic biosynthesis monooxygenase family protein [Planctomycetota bacterium]|jgi:heme-degrading monooxygenase HmoA
MDPRIDRGCYAVIFHATRKDEEPGYAEVSARLEAMVEEMPGYLGKEDYREGCRSITVSYWESEHAIEVWRKQLDHLAAQDAGRSKWYRGYQVYVARVERAYGFSTEASES